MIPSAVVLDGAAHHYGGDQNPRDHHHGKDGDVFRERTVRGEVLVGPASESNDTNQLDDEHHEKSIAG